MSKTRPLLIERIGMSRWRALVCEPFPTGLAIAFAFGVLVGLTIGMSIWRNS